MTLLIGQACWDARLIQAMKITALVTFLHNGAELKSGIRTNALFSLYIQSLPEYQCQASMKQTGVWRYCPALRKTWKS